MAKDPFVELMSSLFGTFSTPPRRPDDAPGGSAAGGEANTLASKGDRLREKEAARRVRQLREQIASRLERPLADLQLIDSQIGAAGSTNWSAPSDPWPGGPGPIRRAAARGLTSLTCLTCLPWTPFPWTG
jgi:hypothetical protein